MKKGRGGCWFVYMTGWRWGTVRVRVGMSQHKIEVCSRAIKSKRLLSDDVRLLTFILNYSKIYTVSEGEREAIIS